MKNAGRYLCVVMIAIVAAAFTMGCHESVPSPEHETSDPVENTGDGDTDNGDGDEGSDPGDRPPADDGTDMDSELHDPVQRFVYGAFVLRFDRPGVMVKCFRGGRRFEFYDIDGNDRASIEWESVGLNDKLLKGFRVMINGRDVSLKSVKVIHSSSGTIWLHGNGNSSDDLIVVVNSH